MTKDIPPLNLGSWLKSKRQAKKGIGECKISVEQNSSSWKNSVCGGTNPTLGKHTFPLWSDIRMGKVTVILIVLSRIRRRIHHHLKLGSWLASTDVSKERISKGEIFSEQIRRLEELGVWWDQPDTWETHFSALERYKRWGR